MATRSLTYTESFSRVNMFFSVLSGAVISLALIAQAGRFGDTFIVAAIMLLSTVLFVGYATIGRLIVINLDDLRWVVGMNRLRHAYMEMHPELEQYFSAGWHDDARGISLTMGLEGMPHRSRLANLAHGVQTLPGMLGVIVAVVAGALGALIAVAFGAPQILAVGAGVAASLLSIGVVFVLGWRSIRGYAKGLAPRFPTPE
ncbi:MAG TPA: hypothetical protein VGS16_06435 [Candidatus Dormibacteraeota bacterium]|nr:hypothetical protein [Candidatus Dormibacteraeota bacterium]